jgi:hypothetical protein
LKPLYIRLYTQIVCRVLAMNRAPEWIEKLKEGINLDVLKTFTIVANSLVLPTPMGVPLSLNCSIGAVMKLDGHIKANSLPSFRDFMFRRPYFNKKIEIEARMKPRYFITYLLTFLLIHSLTHSKYSGEFAAQHLISVAIRKLSIRVCRPFYYHSMIIFVLFALSCSANC